MKQLLCAKRLSAALAGLIPLFLATSAAAHSGHAHEPGLLSPLSAGFLHPLTGWDHLLVIAMIGAFAARQPGGARLTAPALFAAMMLAGFVIGRLVSPFGLIEGLILLSILGMIVLLAAPGKLMRSAPVFFAVFGAAHGMAHGFEAPATGALWFAAGMIAATATLQVAVFAGVRALPMSKQGPFKAG